jgi:hypothetical protein
VVERQPGAGNEQADALRQRSGDTEASANTAPVAESTAPSAKAGTPNQPRLRLRGRFWKRSSASLRRTGAPADTAACSRALFAPQRGLGPGSAEAPK